MENTNGRKPGRSQRHWLLLFILVVLLGAMGQGCVPPPPRSAPRPPTPPGGPQPEVLINVRPNDTNNNFNNFSV